MRTLRKIAFALVAAAGLTGVAGVPLVYADTQSGTLNCVVDAHASFSVVYRNWGGPNDKVTFNWHISDGSTISHQHPLQYNPSDNNYDAFDNVSIQYGPDVIQYVVVSTGDIGALNAGCGA